MACLILDPGETDYRKALNNRLEFWQDAFTIEHKDALWTVTSTKSYEFQDIRNAVALSCFGLFFQGFSQFLTRLGHLAVRVLQILDYPRLVAIRPAGIQDEGRHLLPRQGR